MIREEHIQETIDASINAFCVSEEKRRTSMFEFVFTQFNYIQKRWWLFQGLLLAIMWFLFMRNFGPDVNRKVIGFFAPVFAVMILPELWKNRSFNALEIESCSYYTIRSVYVARLILFGMVDLIMMSFFFFLSIISFEWIDARIIFEFLVPFNCVCIVLLKLVSSVKSDDIVIGVFSSMILMLCWQIIIYDNQIYEEISIYLWVGLLLLSSLFLIYMAKQMIVTSREVCLWN